VSLQEWPESHLGPTFSSGTADRQLPRGKWIRTGRRFGLDGMYTGTLPFLSATARVSPNSGKFIHPLPSLKSMTTLSGLLSTELQHLKDPLEIMWVALTYLGAELCCPGLGDLGQGGSHTCSAQPGRAHLPSFPGVSCSTGQAGQLCSSKGGTDTQGVSVGTSCKHVVDIPSDSALRKVFPSLPVKLRRTLRLQGEMLSQVLFASIYLCGK
jgi:hypothetical protein